VERARPQPGERGRVVGDRVQREARALRRLPAPGRRGFEHQPVGRELDRPVRPASDPRPPWTRNGDRERRVREEREQRRVRLREHDLDRPALGALHLADDSGRAAKRADPRGGAVRRFVGGDPLG
jgi:hypothetical protein